MAQTAYKRLTSERTSFRFSVASSPRTSLWLGSDHLLLVEQFGYRESYKRFYFRDIQAITARETARRKIWNLSVGIPAAICLTLLMVSIFVEQSEPGTITFSIISFIFLLPFVINNIRGTACACQIRTAVQTEDLMSLRRVRQTQKVLNRVRPLIVAAQGQLTSDEVTARMREAAGVPAAVEPEPPIIS